MAIQHLDMLVYQRVKRRPIHKVFGEKQKKYPLRSINIFNEFVYQSLGHLEHGNVRKRCRLVPDIAKGVSETLLPVFIQETIPDTIRYLSRHNPTRHVVGHIFHSAQI